MLLIKCPKKSKQCKLQKKSKSRFSSFLFFLCLSRIMWAGLKLLESVTEPPTPGLVFLPTLVVRLSVSWSPHLSSVLASQSLSAGSGELPLLFPPACVWLPLLFWPPPSFFPLPLLLSLSPVLCLVIRSFREVTESCLFLSPYLSAAAAPQMSPSNWTSIKTTWLWRAECIYVQV